MSERARIHAVTVTHDSADFVELMLRTLFLTNNLSDLDFTMTVLDNPSGHPHRPQLESYLGEHGIPFRPTGFAHCIAAEQHGVALSNFALSQARWPRSLFPDGEQRFIEPDTLA